MWAESGGDAFLESTQRGPVVNPLKQTTPPEQFTSSYINYVRDLPGIVQMSVYPRRVYLSRIFEGEILTLISLYGSTTTMMMMMMMMMMMTKMGSALSWKLSGFEQHSGRLQAASRSGLRI